METNKKQSSTKQLKQVLGFGDLLGTAVGQIIGSGIMTLLGAAIALTGRSVPLAFLVSTVLVVISSIPHILITGTIRVRGGQYTMVGMLAGKTMTGAFIILYIMSNISLAMYGISFASYFIDLFGVGNTKTIAILVLTIFFVLNLMGVDKMAKFQNIIVILMCIALASLAAFGMGNIQSDYFTNGFMTNGMTGLLQAGSLLTFAIGGGYVVTNLSAEAKNPTRDIPLAIILATLAVAVIYAAISIIAAGVLPVEEVAGKNLSIVANKVLPGPIYTFFMVCGAMFALISTLNAQYAWATKPILQACDDGWLPRQLAFLHPKYKTPVVLLTILYGLAVISVAADISMSMLGNLSLIALSLTGLMVSANMWKLPQIVPDAWNRSKFKVGPGVMKVLVVLCVLGSIFNIYMNMTQLTIELQIGNVIVVILAVIFALIRRNKVEMDISYEEN